MGLAGYIVFIINTFSWSMRRDSNPCPLLPKQLLLAMSTPIAGEKT